ncbi:hypothetical protein GCM10018781_60860 [Kitasatospora indigofera]|uniref:Uncharacterized protein n=1 Tax=Kitasatospora indigofera TaxID=67307 RepID=A0A919GAP8_9ACTN|nr:hypothetical protein [Kitasatospora indigofera]GHH80460.1 hypothetical protein GCM10018781_60860 [Kitasatospora indigofera]
MQQPTGSGEPVPYMTCAKYGRPAPWNPTAFCCWACFDARPRDPGTAPLALAYLLGLGPPTPIRHNPNP